MSSGRLYVVATPIGNLDDISPRAVETLKSADLILCEDTRHSRKLLNRFGISASTLSFHEHNEEARVPGLLRRVEEGERLALISDAGTPLLSDPGFRLVRACREAGYPVTPVPGPFAGAAAASVSGLPTDQILFAGFLPSRSGARRSFLETLAAGRSTLVFYLSPHRLKAELTDCLEVLGNRPAFLIREMTKLNEEADWGRLEEIAAGNGSREPRGEYTLVVGGTTDEAARRLSIDVEAYLAGLTSKRGLSPSQAARQAAAELGLPRRSLYRKGGS